MAQGVDVEVGKATDAGEAAGAAVQLVPRPGSIAAGAAERSTDAAEQLAALPPWVVAELFRAEGGFAQVWVELTGAQVARDAEVRRRLAASRDWHAALEIQEGFTRDNLERVAEAVDRCLDLQREMVGRLLAASRKEQERRAA